MLAFVRSAQAGNTLLIMLQTATPDFKARGVSALVGSARRAVPQPASPNPFRLGGGSARIDSSVPLRAHECVAQLFCSPTHFPVEVFEHGRLLVTPDTAGCALATSQPSPKAAKAPEAVSRQRSPPLRCVASGAWSGVRVL